MYDHPYLHYFNHDQQERLKPLNQDYQDIKPTCKQDFLDLQHLSIFPQPYFACHDFSVSPSLMFFV